ncbi:MAG TPA: amino acid adenylation domain-containing protein, partial [Thermoanaerobaculia bacterium]|nr:amino acid adenylation domain-containing protein [Thermoanaerobaculia bacterium]
MSTLSKRVADLSADKLRALAERLKARDGAAGAPRIRPVPRGDEPLPLSFSQERLWFLDRLEEGASSYEIPAAVRLSGPLDPGVLARTFEELERRHESLRTTFGEQGGRPFQRVMPAGTIGTNGFVLPLIDLSAIPEPRREAELLRGAVTGQRFDLTRGPLMRSRLFRFGPEEHALVLSLHHIIADGWSMEVLVGEVAALYHSLLRGRPSQLPPLPVQYADYALWQRDQLRGELLAQELSFWRERLAGIEPLALPTDRPRPARPSFRGAQRTLEVPGDTAALLYEQARRAGLTPFVILTAAWQALLARYTGQTDIALGAPIANRRLAEVQGLIGFFANTVVLRTRLEGDPEVGELLRRVREVVAGAFAHEELPFETLVQELQPERDLSRNPLFQVMVSLQTQSLAGPDHAGLRLLPLELPRTTAKFDLTLAWQEQDGRLSAALEHSTDLFDGDTAGRMLAHLAVLLRGLVEDPARRLSELPLLTAVERRQLLVEWNETAAPYPRGMGLHELFEAQAERTPDAPALLWGEKRVSYRDLDREAGRLARRLARLGVGSEDLVGVFARRTPAMVAGMLAVLKAGAAYLPLDPAYPQERLALLLADSEAPVVLAQAELAGLLPPFDGDVVLLEGVEEEGGDLPRGLVHPDQMAYAIYTSGSTGRPKGVVIRHAGAVARIAWAVSTYGPERLARTLAATSICFDLSVFEIFAPLAAGGAVVLADDALALLELPAAAEVTLVNTVPSAMAELVRSGKVPAGVRTVNLAGEPLRRELADRIYELSGVEEVWDLYGPSEDTTYSTGARVERGSGREPSIGLPLPNSRAYVLDARFEPVPVGVPGELWLGGDGLARGYLDRPDLTADRFRPDPFGGPGSRLYRTGDLARRLASGALDFLGRIDHQVKVRGFRIELGEIEAALLRCPDVTEAVVVAREDGPGGVRLVAYVVAPDLADVQARLAQALPAYMLPSAWVPLPALPLTPNGKVDRKALPAPDAVSDAGAVAPRGEMEELLAGLWAEVLGVERIGADSQFFELGGHSLAA